MKRNLLLALLLATGLLQPSAAQNLALGQWKVHLPFNKAKALAEADNRMYCASERGLFYYNRSDNSVNGLSKIDGLSELTVNTIAWNAPLKTLVIAYANANIDLLLNNTIVNIPDIKTQKYYR
jgi:hypothetical protein